MKYTIDLIDDIRTAIDNATDFSLLAMGLQEQDEGNFTPTWQSNVTQFSVDETEKKIFFYLGKDESINITALTTELNTLPNQQMMFELYLTFSKEGARVDQEIIGFGESLQEKKYLLFVAEGT